MTPVTLPKANENLTEATLAGWLIVEGQSIEPNMPLCTLISDKATFELPSPIGGCVLKLLAHPKSVLPVGYNLCVIGASGVNIDDRFELQNLQLLELHRTATLAAPNQATSNQGLNLSASTIRATPAARRLAKEAGLDLTVIAYELNLTRPLNEKDLLPFIKS